MKIENSGETNPIPVYRKSQSHHGEDCALKTKTHSVQGSSVAQVVVKERQHLAVQLKPNNKHQ